MAGTFSPILIPRPNGPYAVGISTAKLTDTMRIDPLDPEQGKRHVMVSLFYPMEHFAVEKVTAVPYAPPLASNIMDIGLQRAGLPKLSTRLRLQISKGAEGASIGVGKFPLVFFSPGLTFMRHQYNAMAQHLASAGYAVVTMDHAYEAVIVEYPSSPPTPGIISPNVKDEDLQKHAQLLATRVADVQFVLTQLADLDVVRKLAPEARIAFDTEKAVIVGHSFGGATAVSALMQDERLAGAVNMDGSTYGPLTKTSKPVVLFGRGEPDRRDRSNNVTWQELVKHLGWVREINLNKASHLAFSDLPLVLKLGGVGNEAVVKKMVGDLDGERSFEIVMRYVKDILDLVLKNEVGGLYEKPSEEFPEIEFGVNA